MLLAWTSWLTSNWVAGDSRRGATHVMSGHRKMGALDMAGDHDDNPWIFRNYVIVSGTKIVLRSAKLI